MVADHFHVVRLANQVLTEVRQRVTRQTTGRRGRATDPVWANRRKLMRGRERLSQQAFTTMWNALADGDVSNQIVITWIAKEELRALLATATAAVSATTSPTTSPASTPGALAPAGTSPSWLASPAPSRPGGPRSTPSSPPA